VPNLDASFAKQLGESYEQLFITAKVEAGDAISVTAADGVKCPRCWNVGQPGHPEHEEHSELCARCFEVVNS
jgi:isoleucyl-tRNA synthetase